MKKEKIPPGKQKAAPASKTTKQKAGTTLLGTPADTVVVNPEDKRINEKVVNMTTRMHRAVSARKNKSRLSRARELARRRLAKAPALSRRSMKRAKNILRARLAGQAGKNYSNLTVSQKIAIDKMVDRKKGAIKKIALKIAPRIKGDEMRRLQAATAGKSYKTSTLVVSSFQQLAHDMLTEKETKAIMEKAQASGFNYETLLAVFSRGKTAFKNADTAPGKTPSQYAFDRLNSYINGGKAFKEDLDLHEQKKPTIKDILARGMHTARNIEKVEPNSIAPVQPASQHAAHIKDTNDDPEVVKKRKRADVIRRKTTEYVRKVVESRGTRDTTSPHLIESITSLVKKVK